MHSSGMPLNTKMSFKNRATFSSSISHCNKIPEMDYNFFFYLGGEENSHELVFACE
jgi:hypothetical protein